MNAIFSPLNVGLMKISRSRFKQSKKLSAHLTKLCCGVFCTFLGDFWICLEGNSFSQRICKIQNSNIEDLMKF